LLKLAFIRIFYSMNIKPAVYFLTIISFLSLSGVLLQGTPAYPQVGESVEEIPYEVVNPEGIPKWRTIKNINGKLYAYIVFLYMDNQHFINQIQEGTIPNNVIPTDEFKLRVYNNYLQSVKGSSVFQIASVMLDLYSNQSHFLPKDIEEIEHSLEGKNIVLKIILNDSKPSSMKNQPKMSLSNTERPSLGYCIYGRKTLIKIKHPLFETNEKIYNIQPFIYYDEFATSNSTFYFDMIYINPEEVDTDYAIARNVLQNKPIERSLMFVGANVNENIRYSLKLAFKNTQAVKQEIWRMFAVHEITHKILNNHYAFYDQVIGEEMALSSSIYVNPRLGLAVMFSYLDYTAMNPHRIAALNYLRFLSHESGNKKLGEDPSLVRTMSDQEILRVTKIHFNMLKRMLK
jgi:hypothetical protein